MKKVKKKVYGRPQMQVVVLQHQALLQAGSPNADINVQYEEEDI